MGKRVNADIDIKILEELGLGIPSKDIAKHFSVSPAYVSKLKNGKKIPYIHIMDTEKLKLTEFTTNTEDINSVLTIINDKNLFATTEDAIAYIETQLKQCIMKAKILQIILNKIQGGK